MPSSPTLVVVGVAIGLLYGLFGVGSAFATPVLAAIGVPGLAAVVAPLPALLPGSAAGALTYARRGQVDCRFAGWAVLGAVPASVVGAALSHRLGGELLVTASAVVLLLVGVRVLRPAKGGLRSLEVGAARRANPVLVVGVAAGVGLLAGLLANGGGFLLVPTFIVLFGLDTPEAAGTSLTVAAAVTVPTLVTHALLGDIVWAVTLPFALGIVPGTVVGARASS
ncbi:MAG TPA: sulfite exporter TauE/SafE family protein, partial [Acidimicrobiales bacterium]|nr:sulfite exporter TauE/SafE family protein [Acidimicrobiales bacterium]